MTEPKPPGWAKSAAFLWRIANDAVLLHERRMHGPPQPIPDWLYPQGVERGWPESTGEDVLVMVATAEEWVTIARLVATVEPPPGANVRTLWRDGSPWLEVGIVTSVNPPRLDRFAIWRYTLAVHRVGADGAVEDDPMELVG